MRRYETSRVFLDGGSEVCNNMSQWAIYTIPMEIYAVGCSLAIGRSRLVRAARLEQETTQPQPSLLRQLSTVGARIKTLHDNSKRQEIGLFPFLFTALD